MKEIKPRLTSEESGYTINMADWPKEMIDSATDERGNFVHPTAQLGPNVTLGRNNYIGPYCVIGYPPEHKGYWGAPSHGVDIGDNNVFTGLVTIDAGTEKSTFIGNDCWFLKHSHVGHDATIGDRVTISCGATIGGHCLIEHKCNIGLNAVIHQHVIVPEGCMIGALCFVGKTTHLEPYMKYVGVPAKPLGPNIIR